MLIYSLRWYILGKHADIIFTENTNSENANENSLLDGNDCLISEIFKECELPVYDEEINPATMSLPIKDQSIGMKANFDLLNNFEVLKYTNYT